MIQNYDIIFFSLLIISTFSFCDKEDITCCCNWDHDGAIKNL